MQKKLYLLILAITILSTVSCAYASNKLQTTDDEFNASISNLSEVKTSLNDSTKGAKILSRNLSSIINLLSSSRSKSENACQKSINNAFSLLNKIFESLSSRVCPSSKPASKKAKCIPQEIVDLVSPLIQNSIDSLDSLSSLDTNENSIPDICEVEQTSPTPTITPTSTPSPTPIDNIGTCKNQSTPVANSYIFDTSSMLKDTLGNFDFYKYTDDNGAIFKIKNTSYIPAEIMVIVSSIDSFNITNSIPEVISLPGKGEVIAFKICPSASSSEWSYGGYTYTYELGNSNSIYNGDGKYSLPFKDGETFQLIQGETGTFSHFSDNLYSLDFGMPEGSEVTAARSGKVVGVKQDSNEGGPDFSTYGNKANYIWILHDDGSIAYYLHLKQNSVRVTRGQRVNAGEIIGLSGNTGYTTTPHLHFQVVMPRGFAGFDYIPIRFKDISGPLTEGDYYTANPPTD